MIGKNPQHQARMAIECPADLEERGTMLTAPEDCYLAKHVGDHLSGTQQVRQTIGHNLFGTKIFYGDGVFMTISQSERHSGLVLRLSRVEDRAVRG